MSPRQRCRSHGSEVETAMKQAIKLSKDVLKYAWIIKVFPFQVRILWSEPRAALSRNDLALFSCVWRSALQTWG